MTEATEALSVKISQLRDELTEAKHAAERALDSQSELSEPLSAVLAEVAMLRARIAELEAQEPGPPAEPPEGAAMPWVFFGAQGAADAPG